MKQQAMRRLAALALAAAMLAALAAPAQADDRQDALEQNVDQAQQQYDDAQQALEDSQQAQDAAQGQVDAIAGQLSSVRAQADRVSASLNDTRQQLAEARQRLADAEAGLAAKQAEHDATWADTKSMMNAMQRMHDGGSIALLSQASDLYELLSFATVLDQMNGKCQAMLEQLSQEAAQLDAQRQAAEDASAALADAQARLEQQQGQLDAVQGQLADALQAADETLDRQQAQTAAQQELSDAARARLEQAQAELDAYVKSQSQNYTDETLHCSLNFRCPLDSYGSITTQYGDPDPWGIPHHGTDFAAAGGTPIHAAADGVVSVAASHFSYGNYVQVSHGTADNGSRYDTLYAHMSSYCVSVGQQVKAGDVIGYVGNTGQVSGSGGGYHLHLELRVDGARTDPLAWVPAR